MQLLTWCPVVLLATASYFTEKRLCNRVMHVSRCSKGCLHLQVCLKQVQDSQLRKVARCTQHLMDTSHFRPMSIFFGAARRRSFRSMFAALKRLVPKGSFSSIKVDPDTVRNRVFSAWRFSMKLWNGADSVLFFHKPKVLVSSMKRWSSISILKTSGCQVGNKEFELYGCDGGFRSSTSWAWPTSRAMAFGSLM